MTDQVIELKTVADKRFTNKKLIGKDFSFTDLSNADFRNATLVDANFEGSDLTKADFKGANLYHANLKDTIMYKTSFEDAILAKSIFDPKRIFGVTVTMTCDTFEDVEMSRKVWLYWLYMPLITKPPDKDIADRLIVALGKDTYLALSKIFKEQLL